MRRRPTADSLSVAARHLVRLGFDARAMVLVVDPQTRTLLEANQSARRTLKVGALPAGPDWLDRTISFDPDSASLAEVLSVSAKPCRATCRVLSGDRSVPVRLDALPERLMGQRVAILEMTVIEGGDPSDAAAVSARFSALIQGISDAYYDWHVRTGFMDFSPRMEALLGLLPGGLSRAEPGYWERIHPDDRSAVIGHNLKAISSAESYLEEYRMRHSDGHYILVSDWGVVLADPETGEPAHQIGTIRDITQERLAEQALTDSRELYRTLFMAASNPAFRVDERLAIVDANPAAQRLLQQSAGEIRGQKLSRYMPSDFVDGVRENLSAGDIQKRETELRRTGGTHHLLFTIVPCEVSGSRSLFLLGTDVTPLVMEMRSTLRDTEEMLTRETEIFERRNAALADATEELQARQVDVEERMSSNVNQFVMPALERLQRSLGHRPEATQVEAIKSAIVSIARPLSGPRPSLAERPQHMAFTRREAEIVSLVRAGKTTAEIAEALYLSPATVTFHRKNIRKKLGLVGAQSRLDTYFLGEA